MKCLVCHCIFPSNYDRCPVCGNKEITREQFATQAEEVEKVEPISALVVQSEFEVDE